MGVQNLIPWLTEKVPTALHADDNKEVPSTVFIIDGNGGLHAVLHSPGQEGVSASRMFESFMRVSRDWCDRVSRMPAVQCHLVIVMDKPEFVPATKAEEQARRRAGLKVELDKARDAGVVVNPLPAGHVFYDDVNECGDTLPSSMQPKFTGLQIRSSPGAIPALVAYFEQRLRTYPLPANVRLWVDLRAGNAFYREPAEPWLVMRPSAAGADSGVLATAVDGSYPRRVPVDYAGRYIHTPYEAEPIGEGEVASVYYAAKLARAGDSVTFRTNDTDVVPIAYSASTRAMPPKVQLRWRHRHGTPEWFDLCAVYEALRTRFLMPPPLFVYYCAFRGCDHVEKKAISHRLRENTVLENFMALGKEIKQGFVDGDALDPETVISAINPTLVRAAGPPGPKRRRVKEDVTDRTASRRKARDSTKSVLASAKAEAPAPPLLVQSTESEVVCVPLKQLQNLCDLVNTWDADWGTMAALPL